MNAYKNTRRWSVILIMVVGCAPALWTLFVDMNGPFQRPNAPYWVALAIGIPSLLAALTVGWFMGNGLLNRSLKSHHPIYLHCLILFVTVWFAGIINGMVGWESDWIMMKLIKQGGADFLNWVHFIKGIPLMFIYCIIPAGIVAFLNAAAAFIYLRIQQNKVPTE